MEQFWNIHGTTRNKALVTSYQSVTNFGNSPKRHKASNHGACSGLACSVFHIVTSEMEQQRQPTGRMKPRVKVENLALFHCSGFFYPLRAFSGREIYR